MSAIEASFVKASLLVDGTLRIVCDVEPNNAQAAFALFHSPGTAMALAALKSEPAKREKLGPLCEWAVMRCKEEPFQRWVSLQSVRVRRPVEATEDGARSHILEMCEIGSRKQLDGEPGIENYFHSYFRSPYAEWLKSQ